MSYSRELNYKPRKEAYNSMPSFSSTLPDDVYRSTDEGGKNQMMSARGFRTKSSIIEDEEVASLRRRRRRRMACMVDKWMMEKEEDDEKAFAKRRDKLMQELDKNNDVLFFSSTSSSSTSDSSGALSDTATSTMKTRASFTTRPKPIQERKSCSTEEDDLAKYKSRALNFYASLKKVKQPISPGVRLTSFLNSLFNNASGKKSKNSKKFQDLKASSVCSSASSFSRSCLSKFSPKSREKMRDGVKRTVRFHPVISVILDEDSRRCGFKSPYDEASEMHVRTPQLPPNALEDLKLLIKEKNEKVEADAPNVLKGYYNYNQTNVHDDEAYDSMSDSSSDLFELDHLSLFGVSRFCEELPLYETTEVKTNKAVAGALIR